MPRAVKEVCGIPYWPEQSPTCALDLLLPETIDEKPMPAVLYLHGGGWAAGDRADHREELLSLADRGYVVACVGYRLSAEATWPAPILDCQCALRWLRAHATEYHVDPNRVGILGASAGAHLAALMALVQGDTFGPGEPYAEFAAPVQAVVVVAGPSDLAAERNLTHFPDVGPVIAALLGADPRDNPELARSASPIPYVHKDAPPFFIAHGCRDSVVHVSQAIDLARALTEADVDIEVWIARSCDHGFEPDRVQEAWQRFFDFLDRHLR